MREELGRANVIIIKQGARGMKTLAADERAEIFFLNFAW